MSEDKELKQWKEKLFYQPKNGYDRIDAEQTGEIFAYAEGYKQFLDAARTEREAVKEAIRMAEAEGFVPYTFGMELQPGSKVYVNNRGKALMLAVLGQQPLDHGCVIAGAHIDSPRLDLKQTPMYEDSELAYFKTHYYGGIKKYQWVTIPLELHGTVALKDGSTVDIAIGREPDEPQFVITDLLPHLGKDQMRKTMEEGITGEALNIVIGSMPYAGEGRDRVKLAVLSLLYDEYGITEEDFLSAELAAVPAFPARDIGFDRSMIGAYGQDDRVCAYAELRAILDLDGAPERTAVCILADKEEIGSDGVSGMQSQAFEAFMADLCEQQDVALRHCFARSFCLSADVCAAFDPSFPEVSAKRTEAKLNYGMGICKFTGARGKSGTSDASAELVAYLRRLFAKNELDIAVLGNYLNLAHPDTDALHAIQEKYYAHIRFASLLGCGMVGTETGAPNAEYKFCPECRSDAALATFIKNFKPVVRCAEQYGVTIAIEPVVRHIVYDARRARTVLDEIGSPNLQILLDPVNLLNMENVDAREEVFAEAIELLGKDVAMIHFKDFLREDAGGQLAATGAGQGGMGDYRTILRFAKQEKPWVFATLENTTPENSVQCLQYLQKQYAACLISPNHKWVCCRNRQQTLL